MDMNMQQGLVQQQKLILTSEMQQSLKILQMPIFELQQDVERELEENPLLEIEQGEVESLDKDYSEEKDDFDFSKLINYKENINYENANYSNETNDSETVDPLNFIIGKVTLRDYLIEQIHDLNEEKRVIRICNYIVESIDERGYLDCEAEDISEKLNVSIKEVENALEIVQGFQPCGIAARDLRECLNIQLRSRNVEDRNIYKIVEDHLELLSQNKIKEISKLLNIDIKKVQEYCDLIRSLEPKPSRGFNTGNLENYAIPEAYIRKIGNEFYILMNGNLLPRLTINKLYKDLMEKKEDSQVLDYIKDKLNSAVFLIKGIENRNRTIYNILEKIVDIQKQYFEMGEQYLKPMTIGQIAEKLNLHESTVSRAIRDKYVGTSYGTKKIKDLFTTGLESNLSENNVSNSLIKKEIKGLIDIEDRKKPMSDQDICNILVGKGVEISRRTVAKYREEMGICASSKRKIY
jgi:RNA polymerase sigma-54 factor